MEDTKEVRETDYMTNEEYREELAKIFANMHENYKLKWFYWFAKGKIEE